MRQGQDAFMPGTDCKTVYYVEARHQMSGFPAGLVNSFNVWNGETHEQGRWKEIWLDFVIAHQRYLIGLVKQCISWNINWCAAVFFPTLAITLIPTNLSEDEIVLSTCLECRRLDFPDNVLR